MTPGDAYRGPSGERYQRTVHGDVVDSPAVLRAKSELARHRYFANIGSTSRVFEFGVGVGTNLAYLPNEIRHGYDIGEFAREQSSKLGIRVFDSMKEVKRSSYDLVLCRHVLEHVEFPAQELRRLRSLLSDKGQLLLILPIEDTRKIRRRLPQLDVNRHLYAWGPQQLVNLLSVCGLRPTSHRYFWYSAQGKLRWILDLLGVGAYSSVVTLAGRLRRQAELAIWAESKPADEQERDS